MQIRCVFFMEKKKNSVAQYHLFNLNGPNNT